MLPHTLRGWGGGELKRTRNITIHLNDTGNDGFDMNISHSWHFTFHSLMPVSIPMGIQIRPTRRGNGETIYLYISNLFHAHRDKFDLNVTGRFTIHISDRDIYLFETNMGRSFPLFLHIQ